MAEQNWSFEQAATGETKAKFRRFLRAVFCPSHAEIVKRFETANRRTPTILLIGVALAAILYRMSSLSPFIIAIWLIGLMTTDLATCLVRRMVINRPPSRCDIPLFVAVNVVQSSAWCVMPLVLEFRSQLEMFIGIMILMGSLISGIVIASQAQIWFLNLLLMGGSLLAPDIAGMFSSRPHAGATEILIIKILFLLNVTSLARYWHASAKREAAMQAELEMRRRQAEELAAARTMFLAHMSHEIRSPLAGVTLMASLLKRLENVPEDQRQLIEQIDAGGQAILNLLNTALDYSKIEAGKVALSPAPTDVSAVVGGIVNVFEGRAGETNTRLSVSVNGLPPSGLMLDETRLRQILTNLVSNAIKHSPGATVHLTAAYEDGTLLVEVCDTGQGVDEEMKRSLFSPYEQRRGADPGTGLGLAICHGLVHLMGGMIGFRDTQGGGATFWFRIPAPQAEPSPNVRTEEHLAEA